MAYGLATFFLGCTLTEVVAVVVGSVEVLPDTTTVLEGETRRLSAHVRDESGNELSSSSLTWSSDAPSVFAVDSLTGEGRAFGPGQATIWATQSGVRGSGIVFVEPGPSIATSDSSILFQARVGGIAPSPVTLDITNGGGGLLHALSASVEYAPGEPTGWLSPALSGTSAPATLTVSAPLQSLQPGTYHATLAVLSPDARNSPYTVPVEAVVVLDTPIIGLSPTSLEFVIEVGAGPPPPQVVQVTNRGGGVLENLQALALYPGTGGWLTTSLAASTAPTELLVHADSTGLSPGRYLAEIRVTGPGALNNPQTLDVTLTVEVGVPSAAFSTADVPAGRAGAATNVVVQARSARGNPLRSGGATVRMTVSGANSTGPILATDRGDGTYLGSYTPTVAGTDLVAITLNGAPLASSPFSSLVAAGAASPARATATVPGGTAGKPTQVVVQARDAYGNPVGTGGGVVLVSVSGANNFDKIAAADVGDGTYVTSYTPTVAGTDLVAITMNGTRLATSPFASVVGPAAVSPQHATAAISQGRRYRPTQIVVQARDQYGNPVRVGGETVVVTVSGDNPVGTIAVVDSHDGTYVASYTPTRTGTDVISVTMGGIAIAGSPFAVTVRK
jgi:hypothetical protein